MTWGEIRFLLSKQAPGVDLELVTAWINEAYREILDTHPWKGLEADAVLQTVASYAAGTANATLASAAVTGTGTAWTAGMTGRRFRVDGHNEFYAFTYVSATSGTLDRAYEGATVTGAAYKIFQNTYALASPVKYLQFVTNLTLQRPLTLKTRAELEAMAPARMAVGEPQYYAPVSDTAESAPPVLHQIELYPIPSLAAGYPYTYQKAVESFDGTNTTSSPAPWVSPDAIGAGARRRILAYQKDWKGEDNARKAFEAWLERMVRVESARVGPVRVRMAERYTRHRTARWAR